MRLGSILSKSLIFLICIVSMTGCSPHRPISPTPPLQLPGGFGEGSLIGEREPNYQSPWWKAMGDPNLDQVVEQAIEHNLDIKAGLARLLAARAVARQAASAMYPAISGNYKTSRSKQPGFFGEDVGTNYRMSLAASYEIDLWHKVASGAEAARLEVNATLFDMESLIMGVSAQAGELYYLLSSLHIQRHLNAELMKITEEEVTLEEDRYSYGLATSDQLLDARKRAEAARQSLIDMDRQIGEARHSLFMLTGGETGSIGGDGSGRAFPFSPPPLGLPSGLIRYRPDVMAAYLRVEAADRRVAQAVADRFPSFNILGEIGRSKTTSSFGDIVGSFSSLAFSAALTIVDGSRKAAVVEEARARTLEALAAYHKAVLAAFKDVEDALSQYRAAQRSVESMERERAALERLTELFWDRYENGLASYEEVIRSRVQLIEAEMALVRAQYSLAAATISLYRALGGAWMGRYVEKASLKGLDGAGSKDMDGGAHGR